MVEKLVVHVDVNGVVNCVEAHPFDSLASLYDLLDIGNIRSCRILHNDVLLVSSLSFSFYGIKNDDTLKIIQFLNKDKFPERMREIIYPSLSMVYQTINFFELDKDMDTIHQVYQSLLSPKKVNDISRIRDLRYMAIEGNQKNLAKFDTVNNIFQKFVNEKSQKINIQYEVGDGPSEKKLPRLLK